MTYRVPSPSNVFVPSPDASGMVISFSRDPKRFALPKYVQYVPTTQIVGLYTRLDPKQSVRVPTSQQSKWGRGMVRPAHEQNLIPFDYQEYRCQRSDYGFTLPYEVMKSPSWPVLATHAAMNLSQAMTDRTQEVATLLQTTANWSGNTGAAHTLNGGYGQWDQASNDPASAYHLAIKRTLDAVVLAIKKATNARVTRDDLVVVMGPLTAQAISQTDEIRDMLKQSQFAKMQVEGDEPGPNAEYNLPPRLYGLELVVEDSTIVADNPSGPSDSQGFIWTGDSVAVVSRAGGLDAEPGLPSFSTVQIYFAEQLTVETFDDSRNRRTEGHVVDDRSAVLTAPAAGYYITDVLARV